MFLCSLSKVAFGSGEGPLHLVAGIVKGWKPLDQAFDEAFLATYQLSGSNMDQLVLMHKVRSTMSSVKILLLSSPARLPCPHPLHLDTYHGGAAHRAC